MRQIIIAIAIAIAITSILFVGCSKSENEQTNHNEMQFEAQYPAATRATASAFEPGDAMGIYITQYKGEKASPLELSGNYGNNSVVIFDGAKWSAQPSIFWSDGKFDVYAYYPYAKPSSVDEYPFTVVLDQSTAETIDELSGYEASDFLWAKNTGVTKMASVPLVFKHRMSKLIVNLIKGAEYDGEIPIDAVVRIHNTVPTATIDLATGTVTKHGYETTKSITAKRTSNGVYTAIVVPQRIDTKRPLVEIIAKGVSYLIESSFVFKSGTQHSLNITLNINPDKVKIEIGGEVEGGWD